MGFKLLLNKGDGSAFEVLWETDDERVERVGLVTDKGEGAAIRVDLDQPEVIVTLKTAFMDGRPTLYDVEAMSHPLMTGADVEARNDALGGLPSATNQGDDRLLKASIEEARRREDEEKLAQQRFDDQAAKNDAAREDARGEQGTGEDAGDGDPPSASSAPVDPDGDPIIMTSHGDVVDTTGAETPSTPDFTGFSSPDDETDSDFVPTVDDPDANVDTSAAPASSFEGPNTGTTE